MIFIVTICHELWKYMKKIIVVAMALAATSVFAQASNFGGFSAGLNLNTVSTNVKATYDGAGSFDGIGQQSWNGSVQAAYGFVTSPSTVVSVGASYGLGNSKAGTLKVDGGSTYEVKTKNQLSVYVEPGFLFSNSTLVYGKLGYERVKGISSVDGDESGSDKLKGSSFGFGLRTMLDKTSYVQVEVRQLGYSSVTVQDVGSYKVKATVGTAGFGYRF